MSVSRQRSRRPALKGRPLPARIIGAILIVAVWIGAVATVLPLLWAVLTSLRQGGDVWSSPLGFDPRHFTLRNYQAALADGTLWIGFKNTAAQELIILGSVLFFCPLAGYGFAKFQFHGKRFLFAVLVLTLFFVPITQFIPLLLELNDMGLVNTFPALVAPLLVSSLGIFWMYMVIAGVPNELLDAARCDGCGHFSAWWRIVLPVIRPALVSLAVVTFLTAYNDYLWPLLILPGEEMATIQIALQNEALHSGLGTMMAACTIVIMPTVVLFLFAQRFFVRGLFEGSIKA